MANTVKLKRSAVAGKVPVTGDLQLGELALNTNDGVLFFKRDVSGTESIVKVGTTTNLLSYIRVTSNTTAVTRQSYIADTTAGSFTLTLPTSPASGDWVTVVDGASFLTNALTIGRNFSTIEGIADDLSLNISGVSVTFVYDGTTWEVFTQVGAQGGTEVTLGGVQTLTNKTLTNPAISSPTITGAINATGTLNSFGNLSGTAPFGNNATRSLNLIGDNAVMRVARTTTTGNPAVELLSLDATTGGILDWWDFFSGSDIFNIRRRTGGASDILLQASSSGVNFPTGTLSVGSVLVPTISSTNTLTNKTLTSPTINAGTLSGTFSGDATLSGLITLTYTGVGSSSTLSINGYNSKGGTGYHDFLKVTNGYGSATNPSKWFRLNSTGGLEIVNSAYTNTLFYLNDTGDLTLAGNLTMDNRPAFRVVGNGGQISATTTITSAHWTLDYQQGSALNTSTGIFTAPKSGLYQTYLVMRTAANNNSGINQAIIRKTAVSGGAVTSQAMLEFGANTSMNHTGVGTIVRMAAGDTLKVDVTAGTLSFDGNDNWSVAYIG